MADNIVPFNPAAQAVGSINEDPDSAAESVRLEGVTGAPAAAINSDLDGYRQNLRANMAGQIVYNNPIISDYVASHPLAASVSNDDWGNLDIFSRGAQKTKSILANLSAGANQTLVSALGLPHMALNFALQGAGGQPVFDPEWFAKIEHLYGGAPGDVPATDLSERLARAAGGGIAGFVLPAAGVAAASEAGVLSGKALEIGEAITGTPTAKLGAIGAVSGVGSEAAAEAVPDKWKPIASLIGGFAAPVAVEALLHAKPWLTSGKEVPAGVDQTIDQTKAWVNSQALSKLEEDLAAAQTSLTKARSPEMFDRFMEQHYGDSTIGVRGDAAVALYGDKIPSSDDGLLGWVPKIDDQLALAKETGADVTIPVKDLISKIDPTVAQTLRDDIRMWPGGITAREAAVATIPKPMIDAPLPQVRGAASLEPLFSIGDRKLTLTQKYAIGAYQYDIANSANVLLRQGEEAYSKLRGAKELRPQVDETIKTLDSMAAPSSKDEVLYRSMPVKDAKVGDVLTDVGFSSTDRREAYPKFLATDRGEKLVEIRAPIGSHTIDFQNYGAHPNEVVLPRGNQLKIRSIEPDRIVADLLPHGLEPKLAIGERKLALGEKEPVIVKGLGQWDKFQILDDTGKSVGEIEIIPDEKKKQLYVMGVSGKAGMWSNSFGSALILDLARQLKAIYPDFIENGKLAITGHRVTGARGRVDEFGPMPQPVVKLTDEAPAGWDKVEVANEYDAMKQLLQDHWTDIGHGYGANVVPTQLLDDNLQKVVQAVSEEISRVAGKGPEIIPVSEISGPSDMLVRGLYMPFADRAPRIIYDFLGPDPLGVGRHEAVHFLRQYGVLRRKEWNTLAIAAINEGWLDRYGIHERYPNLDDEARIEESVAEAFREWAGSADVRRRGEETLRAWTGTEDVSPSTIFQKIKDFLDRIRDRFREIFGHEPTADELFQKIHSGEVAARGPGKPVQRLAYRLSVDDMDGLRANATGLDLISFRRIQKLIQQRNAEDLEAHIARAQKEQSRRQTQEWKANREEIAKQTEEDLRHRPDVAADLFLGSGELHGQKLKQRFTLSADELTNEQKAALPAEYYSKNGLSVEGVAKMFGFTSGDSLIKSLAIHTQARGELSSTEMLRKMVDLSADRQMEQKFGDLGENVMDEAHDQALSETSLNILAEEMLAAGMKAGQPIDKEAVKAEALERFSKMPVSAVVPDKLLADVGRNGRDAERALIAEKPADAIVSLQKKYFSGVIAAEARKFQKEMDRFNKIAGKYAKAWNPIKNQRVDADFSMFIRDILGRVGMKNGTSSFNLAQAVEKSGFTGLADFITKTEKAYSISGLELPVPDFLLDPKFTKPIPEMTTDEFRAVRDGVVSLDKIGRELQKVTVAGQKEDRAETITKMRQQLADKFEAKGPPATPRRFDQSKEAIGRFIAASTNMDTLFSRFDGRDPHGIFTETFVYPMAQGTNGKARMEREFSRKYGALGKVRDAGVGLDSPFIDPLTGRPLTNFTRGNLATIVSNMGNDYNWNVLAKGWGVDPKRLWKWVEANTTAEDLDRAQGLGKIFSELKSTDDVVYRNLYGVAPPNIKIRPFSMHGKDYEGWYHPIIGDPERSAYVNKMPQLERETNFWPTTPNPFMKRRTGATQVIDLTYEAIPAKFIQIIHDINFKEPIYNLSRLVNDNRFRQAVTAHYGKPYMEEIDEWLLRVAGNDSYSSPSMQMANRFSNFLRQNVISTQIAFNLGTVEKHGLTAAMMSARELDPNLFKSVPKFAYISAQVAPSLFKFAVADMFGKSQSLGDSLFKFVRENSEEIQRRERNYQDTMLGQQDILEGKTSLRNLISQYGAKLVAFSDLLSAAPLWLAKYQEQTALGFSHGEAISVADLAVRRAHGSTAITNLPRIATGNNPLTPWMTSLYGFMGTSMQRRIEIFHDLNDAYKLGMEGNIKGAAKMIPQILSSLAVYVVWTGVVEEAITGQFTDDRRGFGQRAVRFAFGTVAQTLIGFRDLVNDLAHGTESTGLIGTPIHDTLSLYRDLKKHDPLAKNHAGKLVQDGITEIGDLFGLGPKHIGTMVRYGMDAFSGYQHPRTPGDIYRGIVSGTQKLRVEK